VRPAVAHPRRAAGFTLIEVLISITLLALISGICYAAFHLGIRAVGKGEMAVVTAQRLRAATDVLIHQVKSAVASPAMIDGDTYPYFYGTPTSMTFVTEAAQFGGGGRARVKYSFVADPPQLVLEESAYFDAETLGGEKPEVEEARTAVVLDGFRTMSFEFYDGSDSLDCPRNWCASWNPLEAETIPAAIRIKVEGLFGLDEDVWGQEIPLMSVTATYADASGELGDSAELQDCESLDVAGTPSGQGAGSGKGSTADDSDDDDDDDKESD
jgi:general secretion pathway protein J